MSTGTVTSKDGTTIAYERSGRGPAVILVDGATMYRALDPWTPQLIARLAEHLTVFHHDRRGRGESGDTQPFAVEREIEDIDALIELAGGRASLFGMSSGAALAMEAAIKLGDRVERLAMYEAPYNSDDAARQDWKDYRKRLRELLAEDRRGDAFALFLELVGMSAADVAEMRQAPIWPSFEAIAPTLAYDAAALGDDRAVPVERAARVVVPALVMNGDAENPFMGVTARALARAMPNAQHRVLPGQTHQVAPEVIAPVLVEFFTASEK